MENNVFEIAAKEKYRFPFKGLITTEDLWDLSPAQLDSVYKTLNSEKKTTEEDSLLGQHTKEEQSILNKIALVKYIFAEKQLEAEARRQKLANAEKKRRIMELIASKEDAALGEKSIDDLKNMLAELD